MHRLKRLGMVLGGVALAIVATHQSERRALATTVAQEGVIEPRANEVLRQMSDYLTSLKSFRVDATTIEEKYTADGQKIQEIKESRVAVRRPNGLWVDRVLGRAGHVVFRYDGKEFSLYSFDRNLCATAPAPPTLDAAIDDARDRLGIDAPGGDLIVTRPYDALIEGLITGRYMGLEPIGRVRAHHLAMTKKNTDWQIWIQDGPEPVPLRYVITSKDLPTHPQFTLELRRWRPNASLSEEGFTFTPAPGMKCIDLAKAVKMKPSR